MNTSVFKQHPRGKTWGKLKGYKMSYEKIKTNHRITEAELAECEKIVAELHKSDLSVFNQIDIFPLDGDDKKEFLEIFNTYTKNKKTSLPTKESLKYVIDQLAEPRGIVEGDA